MKIQPKKRNTQQGYILVVALIAMLFIGAVFVASSNRSGTEERVATSQLHAASLESAIYAGMYRVEITTRKSKNAGGDSAASVCEAIKSELSDALLGIEKTFQTATDNNPAVYWKLVKLGGCKDYTGDDPKVEKEFQFNLIAWQGDESKPISRIAGNGKIFIKNTSAGPNGEENCPEGNCAGIYSGLTEILKDNAAKSSGTITATGGAKIVGNTTGNEIKVDGGAEVVGGNLTYQNLDVPSWYQWKEDDFWYNLAGKNKLAEAIKVDPLGLKKAINESFFTDESGKKIPLTGLTKTRVKDEFNRLAGGKKVEIGQWPFQRATLKPTRLEVYNDDHRAKTNQNVTLPFYQPVSFLGEDIALMALDEFKIKSGGKDPSLTISGGRVILFIDGDVEMDGGASMQIDSDSSLTLIVTGKFTLTGGFKFLNKNAVNDYGEPLFTLLSSNTNLTSAVQITGGTKLYGVVYSLSDLNLGGSGTIVGQAFGANINASGGTAIDYQPAFGNGDTGENGDASGGSGGKAFTPELDSDFEINY